MCWPTLFRIVLHVRTLSNECGCHTPLLYVARCVCHLRNVKQIFIGLIDWSFLFFSGTFCSTFAFPSQLLSSQVHGLADGNTADNSNTIRDVRGSARRDSIGAVPATTTGASPLTHDCFSGGDVGQHPAFDDRTNCSLSTTSSTETLPRMRTEAPVELPQSMIERKAQKQRKKARNEPLLYMVQGTAKETYPETKESASVADWLRNSSTISYLRTNAPLDCAATDPSSKEIVYSVWQAQRHEARHRAEVAEDTQEEKDAEREDRTEKETEEENVERLEKRRDIHFTPYLPRPAEMVALVERERKRTGGIPEAEREPIECTRTGCPGALVDIKVMMIMN